MDCEFFLMTRELKHDTFKAEGKVLCFKMISQRALWPISEVSLRALYKDPLYLLYTPSMWCLCVKNDACMWERGQKIREKRRKVSFFGVMVGEEVIHELYSCWLARFGWTETPPRMFGLGRETETWEEPFFKQQKKEWKKANLRIRKWKKNGGSWVRRGWKWIKLAQRSREKENEKFKLLQLSIWHQEKQQH